MLGWEMARLDDACVFLNGLWKGKKPPFVEAGVIRNTNFAQDGALDFSDIAYLDVEVKQIEKRRLQLGDIILEKSGGGPKQAVGRVALFNRAEENFSFSNFTSAIRIRDAKKLDYRYLHKYLHWIYVSGVTESMQSHSTGIRNLNGDAYKNIEIAIPALKEQQRIVAILDEAFAGIATAKANAEKNLQNARELFETARESTLSGNREGWAEVPLEDLCEIKHGFAFQGEYFAATGDYVLLTPGNFYESGGYRDRGIKQKHYVGEVPQGFVLSRGDLMVAMTEQAAGLLGSPVLIPESGIFLHNQRLGLVSGKAGVPWRNEFFFHVFNTKRVRQEIHESASGVKVRHTSPKKIGKVVVPFPTSVNEQKRVATRLEELAGEAFELQAIYRQKLSALDELKQSLFAKAFAGGL